MWNYAATFLQVGVGVILLPFILRVFPTETVAIWTIFTTIMALTGLLDFGFNPSFARNVSYVVSGVKELKTTGYNIVESHNSEIDYSLFKGLINAMKWFYARVSVILFLLLATAGTYYMHTVLKTYSGSHTEVYIAWAILVAINSYSLYTMYYDSLMQGKGLIKRSKQIQIVGQSVYLVVAVALILLRFNLIAIVSAQALSIIIRRILAYRTIYTVEFRRLLKIVPARAKRDFVRPIMPNAVRMGLHFLFTFIAIKSMILVGSLFFPLEKMASYGITVNIIGIISGLASVFYASYIPQFSAFFVQGNIAGVKSVYQKSTLMLFAVFFACGALLLLAGDWAFSVVHSKTSLLPKLYVFIALLVECHYAYVCLIGTIASTKNEVPFLPVTIAVGVLNISLLFLSVYFTDVGILALVLIPATNLLNWIWMRKVLKSIKNEKNNRKDNSLCK
jgi:O-antigen/teichoic acid export membrane protein